MDGSDSGAGAGAGAFAVAVAAALKATDRPSTIIVVFSTSTVAGLRAAMLEGADHTRYVHVLGVAHNSFAKKMQASFPQTAQPWMHKDASDIDAILGTIDLSSVNTSHTAIRTALTNVIRINGTSKGIGAVKVMGSAGMIVSSKSAFEKTMTDLFPAPFRFPACIVVPASFFAIITSRGSVAFLCDTTTCNTAVTLQHIMKYTTTYLATL